MNIEGVRIKQEPPDYQEDGDFILPDGGEPFEASVMDTPMVKVELKEEDIHEDIRIDEALEVTVEEMVKTEMKDEDDATPSVVTADASVIGASSSRVVIPAGVTRTTVLTAGATQTTAMTAGATQTTVLPAGVTKRTVLPAGVTTATVLPAGVTTATVLPAGVTTATVLPAGVTKTTVLPAGVTRATVLPAGMTQVLPAGVPQGTVLPAGCRMVLVPAHLVRSGQEQNAVNKPQLPHILLPQEKQNGLVQVVQPIVQQNGVAENSGNGSTPYQQLWVQPVGTTSVTPLASELRQPPAPKRIKLEHDFAETSAVQVEPSANTKGGKVRRDVATQFPTWDFVEERSSGTQTSTYSEGVTHCGVQTHVGAQGPPRASVSTGTTEPWPPKPSQSKEGKKKKPSAT